MTVIVPLYVQVHLMNLTSFCTLFYLKVSNATNFLHPFHLLTEKLRPKATRQSQPNDCQSAEDQ